MHQEKGPESTRFTPNTLLSRKFLRLVFIDCRPSGCDIGLDQRLSPGPLSSCSSAASPRTIAGDRSGTTHLEHRPKPIQFAVRADGMEFTDGVSSRHGILELAKPCTPRFRIEVRPPHREARAAARRISDECATSETA